ncbi:hypothetical protein LJK88_44540 [Paenibacillus sp. P26]|nr:hypothetical protein LJK88_44540 [Paenibacillus sp. P26]
MNDRHRIEPIRLAGRQMIEVAVLESKVDFEYLKYLSESSDKKAILEELMTAYGKDVWNYAYSITRKWDQADDITQEVFIKVYRNLYTFRSESSVKTWSPPSPAIQRWILNVPPFTARSPFWISSRRPVSRSLLSKR